MTHLHGFITSSSSVLAEILSDLTFEKDKNLGGKIFWSNALIPKKWREAQSNRSNSVIQKHWQLLHVWYYILHRAAWYCKNWHCDISFFSVIYITIWKNMGKFRYMHCVIHAQPLTAPEIFNNSDVTSTSLTSGLTSPSSRIWDFSRWRSLSWDDVTGVTLIFYLLGRTNARGITLHTQFTCPGQVWRGCEFSCQET